MSVLNVWYIDGSILGGQLSDLLHDVKILQPEGPHFELLLNDIKCEIITNDTDLVKAFRLLLPIIIHVDPGDSTVSELQSGVTKLQTKFCRGSCMDELQRSSNRLKRLSAHDGLFLLQYTKISVHIT